MVFYLHPTQHEDSCFSKAPLDLEYTLVHLLGKTYKNHSS